MPRAGILWMCTIIDSRQGSGSMGTGPGRLRFVRHAGFGWQKQVGAVVTVGMVVAQVYWGRSSKIGAQRAEKSCDF